MDFVVFFLSLVFSKAESHECCNTWFVHRTGYTFVFLVEVNNTHTYVYIHACVCVCVLRGTGSWTTPVSHEEHNSCAQGYILYIYICVYSVYIYIFFCDAQNTRESTGLGICLYMIFTKAVRCLYIQYLPRIYITHACKSDY